MLTIEDYQNLKQWIEDNRKPLEIKLPEQNQSILLVITEEAKKYYHKRGKIALTLDDLFEKVVLSPEFDVLSEEEQIKNAKTLITLLTMFKGRITK